MFTARHAGAWLRDNRRAEFLRHLEIFVFERLQAQTNDKNCENADWQSMIAKFAS